MNHKQGVGRWGERQAEEFLIRQGYCLLERNARTTYGELDLVMQREDVVVFVEVKTRTSGSFALPEDAVNHRKQQHLLQSAEAYMQAHPDLPSNWRIDVVAITRQQAGRPPEFAWFENAVA